MNLSINDTQNFESWLGALRQACGQFEAQAPQSHALFLGNIVLENLAGLPLTRIRTNAQRITCHSVRNSSKSDCIDDSFCFLVVQRSGYSRLSQDDCGFAMAPGDVAFMDAAYGCEIVPNGLMEHVSIHLDRAHVKTLLPSGKSRIAKLSRTSVSGRLLHLLAGEICADAIRHAPACEAGAAVQEALLALLGAALKDADFVDTEGTTLESKLLGQAKKLIHASLSDPQLTPMALASQLDISVRQLYRLFEEEHDSVCRYIQRMRLSYAAKDLGNPSLHDKSLTDIAYGWGFSDSAHFSRSFKKQFELSPRDYRSQSL